MKKFQKLLRGCCAALLALCVFAGCDLSTGDNENRATYTPVALSGITVDTAGAQTVFTTGASFSADGLVITAAYNDGTKRTVTETATVDSSAVTMSTAGTYTVTVSYTDGEVTKTASYSVRVTDEVLLASIAVNTEAATTTFASGATFTSEGIVVTATYSNGSTKTVTESAQVDSGAVDTATAGTYTVTVSYTDGEVKKTATYSVLVASASQTLLPYAVDGVIAQDTVVPALAVSSATGVSISFGLKDYTADWSMIFQVPSSNFGTTTAHQCNNKAWAANAWGCATSNGTYDEFLNTTCYVTISMNYADNTMKFYKNGKLVTTYGGTSSPWGFGGTDEGFAGSSWVQNIINDIAADGIYCVHPSDSWANNNAGTYTLTDLYIAAELDAAAALSLFLEKANPVITAEDVSLTKGASFTANTVSVAGTVAGGAVDLTSYATIDSSKVDMNTVGDYTVTVTCGNTSKDYTVSVTEAAPYTITDTALTYDADASLANITLPAFDVSGADIFTVSFNATFETSQNDWAAKILSTSDNFILTAPNLDPWNNSKSGSTISGKNAYPVATGAYLANSLAYDSAFTGNAVAITVSFNKADKSIVYTLGGKAWVIYTSAVWGGGIEEFITAFADALTAGTATFNAASLAYSDLVITKGRASGATASEIALASASVTNNVTNWKVALQAVSGCVVYSDGSADAITLADEGLTLSYKNGETAVEESAIATGSYTVTASYGEASATVALSVTADYENTVTGSGTASDPYVLSSTLAETLAGKADSIDCNKYMAETASVNQAGTISWSNPLSGKTLDGFTLTAEVYMTAGAQFDGLLSFFKAGNTADGGFLTIFENGNIRYNSDGYFESMGNAEAGALTVTAATWTKVSVTITTDGTITYYKDGVAVDTSSVENYSGGGNATWSSVNTFLTEFADTIGISVGNSWWKAGFVDEGDYIRSIKIYSTALTEAQIAAIE